MRAASQAGVRFVLVSSSSVYGNATELPTPEHAPPAPLNPYAASKVAAEEVVRESGADAVVVRPFSVYGPGQRPEMAFARWIDCLAVEQPLPWHASPGTARDFTYVDDAVAGILAALRHGRGGEAYNLSGWRSVTCAQPSRHWRRRSGCRPRSRPRRAPPPRLASPRAAAARRPRAWLRATDESRDRPTDQIAAAGRDRIAA